MSEKALRELDIAINPIFAGVDLAANAHRELVFLYGYVSAETNQLVRIHQGLKLGEYLEIPRAGIVFAEPDCPDQESSLTKLVVYADTEIVVAHGAQERILAGELAAAIELANLTRKFATAMEDYPICPPTCQRCNGICICYLVPNHPHPES